MWSEAHFFMNGNLVLTHKVLECLVHILTPGSFFQWDEDTKSPLKTRQTHLAGLWCRETRQIELKSIQRKKSLLLLVGYILWSSLFVHPPLRSVPKWFFVLGQRPFNWEGSGSAVSLLSV